MAKKIFIVGHSSEIEGAMDYYSAYLEKNNHIVLKLEHPLDHYENRFSIFDSGDKVVKIKRSSHFGILNLFIDFFISIKFVLGNNFDIFIGANNFDTFVGIFSRSIVRKKIEKIIYFGSDFSENRFNNVLLDGVYYFIEAICCRYSDLVISNTKRAEEKRFAFGLKATRSIVIPNGVLLEVEDFDKKEINKSHFIFVGSVTKEHGLYALIECIYPLIGKLVLIGYGDDWDRVVRLCEEKNIKSETYYKKDHEFCLSYMKEFDGFGLAPYNLNSKWTYYCSPLKVVEYVACGLPVLMSSLPEIADYIEEKKLGIIFDKLDYASLNNKLKIFDVDDFSAKAKIFYDIFNLNKLYLKIRL